MAITLTGALADITQQPPEGVTSVTIKKPSYSPTQGGIVTSAPRTVAVSTAGEFNVQVQAGLGYLYITGDGWTDSVGFVAAEGMTTILEAMANFGQNAIYEFIRDLITTMGGTAQAELQSLVDQAYSYLQQVRNAPAVATVWPKPALTAETAIDELGLESHQGVYPVPSASVATGVGLPVAYWGVFTVLWSAGSVTGMTNAVQTFTTSTGQVWVRSSSYPSGWGTWRQQTDYPQHLTETSNIDALNKEHHRGTYIARTAAIATAVGLPVNEWGLLEVIWTAGVGDATNSVQTYTSATGQVWSRSSSYPAGWGEWVHQNRPAPTNMEERAIRTSQLRQRVGNVRVGDKGAVALVCDHGTINFRDIVFPMLQERGLSCTLSLNAGRDEPNYMHAATDGDVPWSEIQAWADAGIEIANHGYSHRGATGERATYHEIVEGREVLEQKIGRPIDSWVQPGVGTQWGEFNGYLGGNFDQFGNGTTPESYYQEPAGRMILASHAVVTGTLPGDYWPIDGEIPIGAKGYWLDNGTPAGVEIFVNKAIMDKTRCLLRLHPSVIPDMFTVDELATTLDMLAAKRDAGDLEVLTLRGWAVASQ